MNIYETDDSKFLGAGGYYIFFAKNIKTKEEKEIVMTSEHRFYKEIRNLRKDKEKFYFTCNLRKVKDLSRYYFSDFRHLITEEIYEKYPEYFL